MHDTTCEEIALKVNVYNSVCMRLEGMDQNKKKSFRVVRVFPEAAEKKIV